jgi:hypothetical protein
MDECTDFWGVNTSWVINTAENKIPLNREDNKAPQPTTSTFPQSEEEAISKAQQFDLIYAQSCYLYTLFPYEPGPIPFG